MDTGPEMSSPLVILLLILNGLLQTVRYLDQTLLWLIHIVQKLLVYTMTYIHKMLQSHCLKRIGSLFLPKRKVVDYTDIRCIYTFVFVKPRKPVM